MMKSLPTLLSTSALKSLLSSIPSDLAVIKMSTHTCVVRAPNGVKIISAIKAPRLAKWHVMALPGMIDEVPA